MAIGTSKVTGEAIRSALYSLGGRVPSSSTAKVTASDLFKAAAKYWKWAKYKPVDHSDTHHAAASGDWWVGNNKNCGLNIPHYTSTSALVSAMSGKTTMDDLWTVDVPNGGSSTPYRFGDFAGHDYSKSMIDSCSISFNECYVNDANIINVFYNKSNTKILTYKDIKYGVTSSGSGGTALSDMYAGYVVVKGTNYGVYCEGKLSSTITEGTSYQSLINIDYNAFGNTSGVFTIYPVLFLNNVTTQYWSSSISANIIPLPVEPITLTLTFKDYAAQITSITYNTNTLTVKAKNISSLSINTGGTPINIKLIRYIGGSYDNQNTTTNSITTGVFGPNTTFTGTVTGTFNTADRYQLILTISTTSGEKTIASSGFIKIVNGVFVNENGTSITYPI